MASGSDHRLSGQLRKVYAGGSVAGLSDGALLDRFLASRDERAELAFEALVNRHGPMVRGVCRRVLVDPADADDAFQATFLVLARRAGSIRVDGSLGRWLYGVSRRVAARSRADRDRRRRRESAGAVPERAAEATSLDHTEALAALDDEVASLREPFRSAIILCDLGGLTHEQAALEVGCPVGTIKSRLARGRAKLRVRLIRRGLGWEPVLPWADWPSVPQHLIGSTVRVAQASIGAGSGVGSAVFSGSFSCPDGVCQMMFSISMQWAAGTALCFALGATGLTWVNDQSGAAPPPQVPSPRDPATTTSTLNLGAPPAHQPPREGGLVTLPDYVVGPPDIITVEVLKALPDRPISGERQVRPDGKISLGFYGEVYVAGLTTTEIKEKVVLALQDYLDDEVLGLQLMKNDKIVTIAPAKSSKVFVDVVSFNSKVYYVQGDVGSPGRLPITGNETVLDAITYAGGLIPLVVPKISLVRPVPAGACCEQILQVDFKAITERGDVTTNYQLFPGDRVVVGHEPQPAAARPEAVPDDAKKVADLEARLKEMERKLDAILKKLAISDKP